MERGHLVDLFGDMENNETPMETSFLFDLAVILLVTKVLGILSRRMHLPQVVGAIFAGIVVGPALLGLVRPSEILGAFAQVGVILLMFTAGLETDFRQLRSSLKASLLVAAIGVVVPLAGGFFLALYFGLDILKSIFIGVILTATSVGITVETLHEMGKLKTKAGTAILGAAILDDILGIIILSMIIGMGDGGLHIAALGLTFIKICGFFVFSLICGYGVFKIFEFLSEKLGQKRRFSIFALGFCFFLAYIAEIFGVADITGAYFAGLALCNSRAEKHIEEKTTVLSYMFFSPIFFISVGLMTSFAGLNMNTIIFAVLLLVIAILTKLFGCGLGALLTGHTKRESLQIGTGMISRGEVAIIVAARGISADLMEMSYFSSVIIVVIITTLITPILLKGAFLEKNQ